MRHPERSEGSRFWLRVNSVKNLTKSMRYKTEILRLGPQNDNCDTASKPENDDHWNRVSHLKCAKKIFLLRHLVN